MLVMPGMIGAAAFRWGSMTKVVEMNPVLTAVLPLGLLLVAIGGFIHRRSRGIERTRGSASQWLLSDRGIAAVFAAVAGLGITALLWMLNVAGDARSGSGAGSREMLR